MTRRARSRPVRLAVLRLASACAAIVLAASACGERSGPVHLGLAGPLTEGFGLAHRQGAELAAAEINAEGGINGDSLLLELADDRGEGATAATVAQAFVDDARVSAVVGHMTSGAMVAAAKVYDGHLAAVATTASSADLTGLSRWAFRVISSDSANGVDLARFATRLGKTRAAVLYENDAYGRGLASAFRRSFAGEVVSVDPIGYEGLRAPIYLAWLDSLAPDVVLIAGTERTGLAFLREARARRMTAEFLGGDGWTGIVGDSAAEGALVGTPFTSLDPRPEAQRFVTAFRARYGTDPDGNAALAYDAVHLLAAAVRAVGRDRTAIRDWLAGLQGTGAYGGVTGPIAFLESGDPVGKAFTMTRVVGGKLTVVDPTAPDTSATPAPAAP